MPVKKPFPLTTFSDALSFAQEIAALGADGPIKRLTLLGELGKSPGSSATRSLITHSSTYGLTRGGYKGEFIELTDHGRAAVDGSDQAKQRKKHFDLAITRIDPFRKFFEKYKGKSVPNEALLKDALQEVGIPSSDTDRAMATLLENLQFVGAMIQGSGKPHIDMPSFDAQSDVGTSNSSQGDAQVGKPTEQAQSENLVASPSRAGAGPSLHIDVQVHIDSSATTEQIDRIFRSMATHLYGSGSV